jgi:CheY-like chemotaxis protein
MARLLLVDDDRDVLDVLDLLLSMEGHSVRTALDGVAALDLAHAEDVDIVITDLMMPRMDGLELCRRLRAHDRTRRIPIVLHTAAGRPPPGEGTLFEAILSKPSELEDHLRMIARLVPPREPADE